MNSVPDTGPKSTKPTRTETEIANLRGLVDEARAKLDRLVAIHCYVDGDPDVLGGTKGDEMREEFNERAAGVVAALDAIRTDVEKVAAVAIDAGLAGGRAQS